jgi:hypothetical protein
MQMNDFAANSRRPVERCVFPASSIKGLRGNFARYMKKYLVVAEKPIRGNSRLNFAAFFALPLSG